MNSKEQHSLTLKTISETNLQRALIWHPEGIDSWSASDWAVAMVGEAGELCNAIKKLNRLRDSLIGNKQSDNPVNSQDELMVNIANEIGGTFAYLDLLAQSLGLSLETCVIDEFNRISKRNGFEIFLG